MDDPPALDPGYYVIAYPQQERATVITGPSTYQSASHKKTIFTHDGWIMATPMLVHAIEDQGYEVEWGDGVRKPDALTDE